MRALSDRSRLIAIVTVVLVLAFAGTNLVSHHVSRQAMRTSLLERELPLTGDNIYSEIQADLVRPTFISSLMARDTFLRDWVLAGEQEPERMRRFLDEIRQRYDVFTAFFVSEETRRYYHFSGVSKRVSADDPRDRWFFRVREMSGEYEINVDPNQQQDDRVTVFINHRVEDYEGGFIGVTGVGLALDTVARIVDRYRDVFGRTVYFVDANGRITVHPDPELAYRARVEDLPGMAQAGEEMFEAKRGAFVVERPDGTALVTTRYIPKLEWTLVVEEDESEATAALDESFLVNLGIGAGAILLTTLAIGFTVSGFQRRLERMATTDSLTGLFNRQVFDIQLRQSIERARRTGEPLSLLIFDLDRFKAVNDRHGHLAGDEVLRRVASVCADAVRASDVLCRWGGEEFALLAERCDEASAHTVADGLRERIEAADLLADHPELRLTASFGSATLREDDDAKSLVSRADGALYAAKDAGRNRVESAAA